MCFPASILANVKQPTITLETQLNFFQFCEEFGITGLYTETIKWLQSSIKLPFGISIPLNPMDAIEKAVGRALNVGTTSGWINVGVFKDGKAVVVQELSFSAESHNQD